MYEYKKVMHYELNSILWKHIFKKLSFLFEIYNIITNLIIYQPNNKILTEMKNFE